MKSSTFITAVGLGVALVACGAEPSDDAWKLPPEKTQLKPGAGRELVLGQCVLCHSADYITTQPPFPRPVWQAAVEKMRARYGAPVPTNSIPSLVDYLVTAYGNPNPKLNLAPPAAK